MTPIEDEISRAVRTRRREMGLTTQSLATVSGSSLFVVNRVEAGAMQDIDLCSVIAVLESIGLRLSVIPARPRLKPAAPSVQPLDLAAMTASVSYQRSLPPDCLADALLSGELPAGFEPHIGTLLDEAPVSLLAKIVEQLHADLAVPREQTWRHMRALAVASKSMRALWNV